MSRFMLKMVCSAIALMISTSPVFATSLEFKPADQLYDVGDTITFDLIADIDQIDAIYGFGFDLSFDGGASYVSGPGDSGSFLTFDEFQVNSIVFDDPLPPLWDDGDSISGAVDVSSPDVWGTDILLGTFVFDAPISGPIGIENIYLGPAAGDYGIYGEEGLLGTTAFMPNNPSASTAPVPEPTTWLLFGTGILGLLGYGRKKFFKQL